MRWGRPVLLPLLLAAAIVPFAGALRNGFVWDDRGVIERNPAVTQFDLKAIWSGPYWPGTPSTGLFRPVTTTTYAISWAMGGGRPAPFIAANVVLHAATVLAALWLTRRLFPRREGLSWAAAFLFATHPIHVEAVAGIVGRAEILAALFALLSYVLWLRGESDRAGLAAAIGAPILWFAALLSKESAVALPLLLVAHRLGWIPSREAARRFRAADLAWPAALLAALALRLLALGSFAGPAPDRVDNPLASLPAPSRILGAFGVLAQQMGQLLLPVRFSSDYSFAQVRPGGSLYALGVLALLATLLIVAATLLRGRRSPEGWGILFFLFFWIVTGNVLVPIGTARADRLLYLPLLGLLVVAASLIGKLLARFRLGPGPLLLPGLVVLAYGFESATLCRHWRDDLSLFSSAVEAAPRSLKARSNLAALLLRAETPDAARQVLDLIAPVASDGGDYGPILYREGKARMYLGEVGPAEELYERALAAGVVDSAEVLIEMGNLFLSTGDAAQALSRFEQAKKTGRLGEHAEIGRASSLSLLGRYEESAALWSALTRALPDSVPIRIAYAWNLRASSRAGEAVSVLRQGLAAGGDPRLWDELARALLAAGGRPEEALDAAEKSVARGRSDRTLATLARAQIAAGRFAAARETCRFILNPDSLRSIDRVLAQASRAAR